MHDLTLVIFVVSIVSIVLVTSFTAMRIWIRYYHRTLGIDDYFALVGLVFWLVCLSLAIVLCLNGLGAHGPYTDMMKFKTRKYFFIFQDIYVWANIPVKISVCLSIHRVVKHYNWIAWTLYVVMFIIASSSIATNIFLLTFCKPVAAMWDPNIPGGTCRPAEQMLQLSIGWSYINIVTDWVVALLPVFVLWRVNMPWKQKVTVAAVLSLGIFASTATIVRLVYLPYFTVVENYLYGLGLIILWTILELTVAIVAVSLIALRPLLRRFFARNSLDKCPDGVAAAPPNTRQLDNRFFRMHGWSLQFGLDSYVNNSLSTRPSNGLTESSTAQGSIWDPDLSQPPRPIPE